MDISLLTQISTATQNVSTFIGIITGGVILTYFILPHVGGHLHASFINLIWITFLLAIYQLWVREQIVVPALSILRYGLNMMVYKALPYEYAVQLWNSALTIFGLYILKKAFFPHHRQHHKE